MKGQAVRVVALLIVAWALALPARGAAPAAADAAAYAQTVKPFFAQHCFDCHDSSVQKGGLNLETLKPSFATREEAATWTLVVDRMERGEMPPPKKPRPAAAAQGAVLWSLGQSISTAQAARNGREGRSAWRRLNRVEYENTVHDLLGIETPLKTALPEDGLAGGFSNVGAALDLSAVHLEKYLETADLALDAVFNVGWKVERRKIRYSFRQIDTLRADREVIHTADAAELTNEFFPPKVLKEFRGNAPVPSHYVFRMAVSAVRTVRPLAVMISIGNHYGTGGTTETTQLFDVPPGEPAVHEWTETLPYNHTIRLTPMEVYRPVQVEAKNYAGPGVAVHWIEAEGPIDPWPAESYTRLLGAVDIKKGTFADAQTILKRFLPRAFRREVGLEEMEPYFQLVKSKLAAGGSFEGALRLALRAALISPDFLFSETKPGRLDDYALASRLSYFLWSTMPDAPLLTLAGRKELGKPAVLRAQVERMLGDRKARAFTADFTAHWLKLRDLHATNPDPKLYPEYDTLLDWCLPLETHAFFDELLTRDLSVLNFVHSDFAMLNQRMAQLYGIPGVDGFGFRKVALKPEWHRGGVMTQAAVLKVTANGSNTSPVPRGVFFLDRILGRPVQPPPKNTPAIEPDTRGATTIRQQLAKHREVESCATCHNRIDPVGGTLEAYDVIGQWRDRYRINAEQKKWEKNKEYALGQACETAVTTQDGKQIATFEEIKQAMLADAPGREQFARALAEKLLVYGTGHELEFADRAAVTRIIDQARGSNYGLRTLVHAVVQSPTFLNK
jgi:hypothetical protein